MTEPATGSSAHQGRAQSPSNASLIRRLSNQFEGSTPAAGFAAATSDIASSIFAGHAQSDRQPLVPETRKKETTIEPSVHTGTRASSVEGAQQSDPGNSPVPSSDEATLNAAAKRDNGPQATQCTEPFTNGYHFPPKHPWQESTREGLLSFWKFFITPMGFFWTIYGLNVVAWGGMLFLLLCNAAPAMCYPSCNDIDSPRRKWVEYDSQILTVLFCVPAFGLAPWRFRDLYYLLKYRFGNQEGLRRLGGIHNNWLRLPGSQDLAPGVGPGNIPEDVPIACVPIPEKNMPTAPLSGTRAPATKLWKLDFVIWSMVWNTFAQCGLCGIMWGMNRYTRPSWTTGFLVAIACVIAMIGGLVMFLEGKKVKGIEGVPLTERDREKLAQDKELGIPHYNNIKDKKPKGCKSTGDSEK